MSGWAVATWAAVACLSVGSLAVFVWFLRDAVRLFKARRPGGGLRPPPGG